MAKGFIRFMCPGVLLVLAVVSLQAGGWVVITVTDVPDAVRVGKPATLTYAVRQHGRTLLGDLAGRIEVRAGTHVVRVAAVPAPEPGHYTATFTVPYAGDWTVDIVSGFGGQFDGSRMTLQAIEQDRPEPPLSEAERGRRLFVAKGCITCHVHDGVDGRSTSVGPTLTAKRYQSEYLRGILARPPKDQRGEWRMPDLKLHEKEISSLVAFINAESRLTAARTW